MNSGYPDHWRKRLASAFMLHIRGYSEIFPLSPFNYHEKGISALISVGPFGQWTRRMPGFSLSWLTLLPGNYYLQKLPGGEVHG